MLYAKTIATLTEMAKKMALLICAESIPTTPFYYELDQLLELRTQHPAIFSHYPELENDQAAALLVESVNSFTQYILAALVDRLMRAED